ncbi:acyl-CoA dehydrogenase family protein [Desulfatitalea tepidiphila]|uniref:acyl-CoA dehydrogenase family protein n=1 Tax=Desulfatitalea tepidiphila TaxID=1185843 RepID=UPI002286C482|nr:acyl-CoA dehydrogenase [Desulfatitalea tepidiphila]
MPAANLLGKEGAGFLMAMDRINVNRLLHCPTMIGLAQNLLDRSIAHAKNRKQFGRSIGDFQAIQHMLANMAIGIYAGRSMVLAAAAKADTGQDIRKEAAMCKVFCSEKAFEVSDLAVQIHGNVGITKGHPVEVLFRTLRMYRIVVGTSEIQRNTIVRALLKESKGLPQNQ